LALPTPPWAWSVVFIIIAVVDADVAVAGWATNEIRAAAAAAVSLATRRRCCCAFVRRRAEGRARCGEERAETPLRGDARRWEDGRDAAAAAADDDDDDDDERGSVDRGVVTAAAEGEADDDDDDEDDDDDRGDRERRGDFCRMREEGDDVCLAVGFGFLLATTRSAGNGALATVTGFCC
jgi:hypothetical protein